jgi:hypothetical protein
MSATYDDPNREALGLPPIWTGAGDVVEPQPTDEGDDLEQHRSRRRKAKDDADE